MKEGKLISTTYQHNILLYFKESRKNNVQQTILIMNKKFWEELIPCIPLIQYGEHRKRLQQFFLTELLPSNYKRIHRQTHRHTRPTILILLRVLVAAGTCLSTRCLVIKGRIYFTEPLPRNDRRNTHTDTEWWEGFLKYTAEMGSGVMIYIPSFIKIGPGIQKLLCGIHGHRQHGDRISLL
jgi:hypothetical protein